MSKITKKVVSYRIKFDPVFVPYGGSGHWVSVVEVDIHESEEYGTIVDVDTFGVPARADGQPDGRKRHGLISANFDWRREQLKKLIEEHNLTDVQAALNREERGR